MNLAVESKFNTYPPSAREKLELLRSFIICEAKKCGINDLTETLKWNEPSYISPHGSAIRIDYKQKHPTRISIYFNCKTCLISTFKAIYPENFNYVGNREIYFDIDQNIPTQALKHCIRMALHYKNRNNLDQSH